MRRHQAGAPEQQRPTTGAVVSDQTRCGTPSGKNHRVDLVRSVFHGASILASSTFVHAWPAESEWSGDELLGSGHSLSMAHLTEFHRKEII